jgi:hypothetical protein
MVDLVVVVPAVLARLLLEDLEFLVKVMPVEAIRHRPHISAAAAAGQVKLETLMAKAKVVMVRHLQLLVVR